MIAAPSPAEEKAGFAARIISWQKIHGRHDLPWQNTRDPYAIWVSEIMLQQTQVASVIGYYQRFMNRFPDIPTLATATQDEVLQHWSGLGYYSRARNLHAAAQRIMQQHAGQFPQDIEAVQALPGIGRSTAAAITAFAFGHHRAILDGNVKRVLARCFGIEGWSGLQKVEKQMWRLAEDLLPSKEIEAYIQGLMDLGATLCSRNPACPNCPLLDMCSARRTGKVLSLPSPKPRKVIPHRETTMILLLSGNGVLLHKRPSTGIWGGLWSLPEIDTGEDAQQVVKERMGLEAEPLPTLPTILHTFTHFTLKITPQPLKIKNHQKPLMVPGTIWLDLSDASDAALPAPVKKLLRQWEQNKKAPP